MPDDPYQTDLHAWGYSGVAVVCTTIGFGFRWLVEKLKQKSTMALLKLIQDHLLMLQQEVAEVREREAECRNALIRLEALGERNLDELVILRKKLNQTTVEVKQNTQDLGKLSRGTHGSESP